MLPRWLLFWEYLSWKTWYIYSCRLINWNVNVFCWLAVLTCKLTALSPKLWDSFLLVICPHALNLCRKFWMCASCSGDPVQLTARRIQELTVVAFDRNRKVLWAAFRVAQCNVKLYYHYYLWWVSLCFASEDAFVATSERQGEKKKEREKWTNERKNYHRATEIKERKERE